MPPLSRPQSQQISSRNDFCGFEEWHHSPELAGSGLGGLKLEMLMIEISKRCYLEYPCQKVVKPFPK
jgi:hypothetical protein